MKNIITIIVYIMKSKMKLDAQYFHIDSPFIFMNCINFSSFSYTIEYMNIGNSKDKARGNKVAPIIFNRAYI
jgi:hypothetical protein